MFSKLKQFKDLRSQAKQMQNNLAQETVEVTSCNEQIKITMDGNQKITAIDINPELLTSENKTKIEDGIKDAISDATQKIHRIMAAKMQESGFNLPGME